AVALAGCGSSSSTTSKATSTPAPASSPPAASSGASTVSIAANPGGMLMFTTNSLTAKAGKVTIAFTNNAPEDHNITLTTASGSLLGSTPTFKGGTKMLTVSLKPGTYTYYCSVPGHRSGGMQGKLVVS
ncbi:MAG TPA: plastocyanin/azurin family copper-binding protein, partial [Solirubrobacteraceae bacterium]|nr:plastocyanin/azurin family copper-binding protein [Solirubrobacteraceae bacterium]